MAVPKRVSERISAGLKRMGPIIQQQKARDVSEADTVTLVKDLLSDVFGYDKYAELTGELAIRGTFCDLAIRLEGKTAELIEVKAIGITLNDRHVKQAVDYAANQGVEWVILTNAVVWQLFHVVFSKPIDKKLVAQIDLTTIDTRNEHDIDMLHVFTKEGFNKGVHAALRDRQDATNRFLLAALVLENENVLSTIRRELKRVVDINVADQEILKVLQEEVIKRDVLEGPPADEARLRLKRAGNRALRQELSKVASTKPTASVEVPPAASKEPPVTDISQGLGVPPPPPA